MRTAQLYGYPGDFVHLVYETVTAGQKFIAFANLVNCPTWIGDLFPMVTKIINHRHQGIYHCVGLEAVSRYEYACKIAQTFDLHTPSIQAVNLDFSRDIRPPIVRLNGESTYKTLQVYPKSMQANLPLCRPYAIRNH